jgi:hypothetical protein
MKNALCLQLVIAIALTCLPAPQLTAQAELEVRFGILVAGGGTETEFVETTRVPNVVGQSYGWRATIAPRPAPFEWFEELRLPTPPREWEGAAAISDDRKVAQTHDVVPPYATEFSNFWVVTPGDPSGRYSLVVKISDGVVASFSFDVVDALVARDERHLPAAIVDAERLHTAQHIHADE